MHKYINSKSLNNRVFFSLTLEEEDTPAPRLHSYGGEREELSLIRTMIFDLQEEKENLKKTDIRLTDELYKKQKHLDDIYNLIDELKDVKADKELLNIGFDMKADKREIDTKIGRHDFDHYMSLVDQSLRDLLQRLEGHVSCFSVLIINIALSSNVIGLKDHAFSTN